MSEEQEAEKPEALPGQLVFSWGAEASRAKKKKKKTSVRKSRKVKTAQAKTMKKSARKTTKKSPVTKKKAVKKTASKKVKTPPRKKVQEPVATSVAADVNFANEVDCFDLKWGARMPKLGLGFWKIENEKTPQLCEEAIRVGYRHLDCACDYGNEAEVGQGIASALKNGLCEREDLWVTSKLWNTYHDPRHVQQACEKSLADLGVDYLDLYLVHFPIAQRFVPFEKRYPPGWFFNPEAPEPVIEEESVPLAETWKAMENLAKSGLVKNIGICNVGTSQIRDLLATAKIRPSVLQVESHPFLAQEKLLRFCQKENIVYTAFSPLGAESYYSLGMAEPSESMLQHKVVRQIAKSVGKTPAQVLLRWGVQRGTAVIPKTSQPERLVENIDVFGFSLDDSQMQQLTQLDTGRRFNDPGDFGEKAFNTFLPIYE